MLDDENLEDLEDELVEIDANPIGDKNKSKILEQYTEVQTNDLTVNLETQLDDDWSQNEIAELQIFEQTKEEENTEKILVEELLD